MRFKTKYENVIENDVLFCDGGVVGCDAGEKCYSTTIRVHYICDDMFCAWKWIIKFLHTHTHAHIHYI